MKKFEKIKIGIATEAYHKLGNISRNELDFCVLKSEDELNYYGNWLTGYGFIDVQFPKAKTRIASDMLTRKILSLKIGIIS